LHGLEVDVAWKISGKIVVLEKRIDIDSGRQMTMYPTAATDNSRVSMRIPNAQTSLRVSE